MPGISIPSFPRLLLPPPAAAAARPAWRHATQHLHLLHNPTAPPPVPSRSHHITITTSTTARHHSPPPTPSIHRSRATAPSPASTIIDPSPPSLRHPSTISSHRRTSHNQPDKGERRRLVIRVRAPPFCCSNSPNS
ncbi:hypothetical protein VPH35_009255 [Triticum aestivum]